MAFFEDNEFAPVTAILSEEGDQLFETAGIRSLGAKSSKAYAQHTLENGVKIADHTYELQDRVNMQIILDPDDYVQVYRRIKKAWRQNTAFIIQTKVETYSKMYIETLPHEEDNKNTITLSLDFIQQRFQAPTTTDLSSDDVASEADTSTSKAGNKRGTESTEQQNQTTLQQIAGGLM